MLALRLSARRERDCEGESRRGRERERERESKPERERGDTPRAAKRTAFHKVRFTDAPRDHNEMHISNSQSDNISDSTARVQQTSLAEKSLLDISFEKDGTPRTVQRTHNSLALSLTQTRLEQ
jgi:hypothetical protein